MAGYQEICRMSCFHLGQRLLQRCSSCPVGYIFPECDVTPNILKYDTSHPNLFQGMTSCPKLFRMLVPGQNCSEIMHCPQRLQVLPIPASNPGALLINGSLSYARSAAYLIVSPHQGCRASNKVIPRKRRVTVRTLSVLL